MGGSRNHRPHLAPTEGSGRPRIIKKERRLGNVGGKAGGGGGRAKKGMGGRRDEAWKSVFHAQPPIHKWLQNSFLSKLSTLRKHCAIGTIVHSGSILQPATHQSPLILQSL